MLVSIIIPTLNEESNIASVLRSLASFPDIEILIVDGGSSDRTCEEILPFLSQYPFMRLVRSSRGRSVQMNAGAAASLGEWFVFLHADTIIPGPSWAFFRHEIAENASICSGSFLFKVRSERWRYRIMEKLVNIRSRLMKLPYGDQALFVRKDLFHKMKGFREDFPLMEDLEFVKRLVKERGFKILKVPIITSPRRYEKEGFFTRIALNLFINLLYRAGIHPKKLVRFY